MQICRQGNGHYLDGINNQDFCYMEKNLKLLTDGCSEGKFSEVGTRLFNQYFSLLDDRFNIDKFEENVKETFIKIVSLFKDKGDEVVKDFIVNNMLFTIVACFELEDKFVVKSIGDGYIITVNSLDMVSFTRLFYGKRPPYYAYNFIQTETYNEKLNFKTFEFSKEKFKNVGLASDGIGPIVDKRINEDFTPFILGKQTKYTPEGIIKSNQANLFDDITIVI